MHFVILEHLLSILYWQILFEILFLNYSTCLVDLLLTFIIIEIGRRYKVMNPEKMRSEYGKLIYMLQDSMLPHVQELLNFKVVKPMTTVHLYLSDRDAEELLTDPLMAIATREILSDGKGRHEVNKEVRTYLNTAVWSYEY